MRYQNPEIDADGLQADVMRFMAIIAFCLIAVLALVKNLEQTTPATDSPTIETATAEVELNETEAVDIAAIRQVVAQQRVAAVTPAAKEIAVRIVEKPMRVVPKNDVVQTPDQQVEETSPALRFASDRAFMQLIAQGKIEIYEQSELGFRSLSSSFTTIQRRPSGAVYQLLPASVPKQVSDVFRPVAVTPTYLVALPTGTRQQIVELLRKASGGTLVIQRNGDVIHES